MQRTLLRLQELKKIRPTMGHTATSKLMKYIPPRRNPHHPARVGRENLLPEDLSKEWLAGRGLDGPSHPNSGFSTKATMQFEDSTLHPMPVHELSKFMPDITVPGIQSTPVSMMNARNGHRVSHDLIHSYDPYLSQVNRYEKQPLINHDEITPYDEKRHGLHPRTFGSRARMYRYLRRSPHRDEELYYKNYIQPFPLPTPQAALQQEIIKAASKNDIEGACATYRVLEHPPQVDTIKAMMKCCARLGLLGDCAALFEDALRINRKLGRDPEVLDAYLDASLLTAHPARAMFVLSYVIGTKTDNIRYNAEVPDVWKYRMGAKALAWMLEKGHGAEAQSVYAWLESAKLLNYDNYEALGQEITALLQQPEKEAKDIILSEPTKYATTKGILQALIEHHGHYRFLAGFGGSYAAPWLENEFPNIDIDFVLRLARSSVTASATEGQSTDTKQIAQLAHAFLLLLVPSASRAAQHTVLPYMLKTKPSSQNPQNVYVVPHDGELRVRKLRPHEAGYRFGYKEGMQVVTEVLPELESTGNIEHLYYGRQTRQQPTTGDVWFS